MKHIIARNYFGVSIPNMKKLNCWISCHTSSLKAKPIVLNATAMIAPRLHAACAGSFVTSGDFLRTIARPVAAASLLLPALLVLRPLLSGLDPAARLATASVIAAPLFLLVWLALPGGRASAASLFADVRLALRPTAAPNPACP